MSLAKIEPGDEKTREPYADQCAILSTSAETTRNDDEWERAERKHERAHACDEERNGERSRGERDERGGTFV